MVDNQEDADSLCCYQCRGAITIRWQGTRARPVATWALCSQAQRYYKHVQRAHDFEEVLLITREEEAKRKEYEHMQEKEAFRQEMMALREDSIRREREEREEREALMAVQLRREEDIEALREELQEWRQKWEEMRANSEKVKEGRALTEVQRRLFRTPTSPLTQPHPPQPVPQPSPLLGMVEIEDPILQEVEPEVDEVAQVEERATWQNMRRKIRQHFSNSDGCIKISCCSFKVELMKQKLTPRQKYEKWDEVARHLSSHLMCNHKDTSWEEMCAKILTVTTEPEIL